MIVKKIVMEINWIEQRKIIIFEYQRCVNSNMWTYCTYSPDQSNSPMPHETNSFSFTTSFTTIPFSLFSISNNLFSSSSYFWSISNDGSLNRFNLFNSDIVRLLVEGPMPPCVTKTKKTKKWKSKKKKNKKRKGKWKWVRKTEQRRNNERRKEKKKSYLRIILVTI